MHQYREPRIPVLSFVDEKLLQGKLDGYQYEDLPDDRDTWRIVAAGLDYSARAEWHAKSFAHAPTTTREDIVKRYGDRIQRAHAAAVMKLGTEEELRRLMGQ